MKDQLVSNYELVIIIGHTTKPRDRLKKVSDNKK